MNKNLKMMYVWILKQNGWAQVTRSEDGVYGIEISKNVPGNFHVDGHVARRFFYLYPRNPYVGEFIDE